MSTPNTFKSSKGFSHRNRAEMLEHGFLTFVRQLQNRQNPQAMQSGLLPDYLALGWVMQRNGITELTDVGQQVASSLAGARRVRRLGRPA